MVMRRRSNGTVLVIGGTGFLGSHILTALLASGRSVCVLARSKGRLSAEERVRQVLDWFGLKGRDVYGLSIIEGSIDQPDLGIRSERDFDLIRGIDEIIHCGSATSFSERKREEVVRTNIHGIENVLDVGTNGACSAFHYVSTAYVAGSRSGTCTEALSDTDLFTNVYEETKCRAERIALDRCARKGIRCSIYRPSIVYGDSRTGRSLKFNGVYYPVRTLLFLKNIYEADLRERGGRKAAEAGVKWAQEGVLYLPIRVELVSGSGVNLIPVNYFVSAFMSLRESGTDRGIFHIVNGRVTPVELLIAYARRLFKIDGLEPRLEAEEREGGKPRNQLEVLFDLYLQPYLPYIRDTRTFENGRAQSILSEKGVFCPEFSYDIFARCMSYGLQCGWGARLFGGT
jgi:nucleoside-diphosphate-sugar epimerase